MNKQFIISKVDIRFNILTNIYLKKGIILKDYQEEGVRWMLKLEEIGLGGLLADEPGLGKTYQSLGVIVSDTIPGSISLVAVPSSTLPQWTKDAKMLLGDDAVYVHHGSNRKKFLSPKVRMVLTTPETLMVSGYLNEKNKGIYLDLHIRKWTRIIIDEVHVIRNARSKLSKCMMKLRANHKWGLSGTPIQNKRCEIINLFRFVTQTPANEPLKYPQDTCIKTFLKRRTKRDKLDLKPIEIENFIIDFATDEERDFYNKVKTNIKKELVLLQDSFSSSSEEMVVFFELLLRLRQASQHPQLVVDGYERKYERKIMKDWVGTSSKHEALRKLILGHKEDGSVVFSQFTKELNIIQEMLTKEGLCVDRIDGSLSQSQKSNVLSNCANYNFKPVFETATIWTKYGARIREGLPEVIQDKIKGYLRPDVLLIQIKAGGVGLNLQSFNRVYITTPDWNPSNEDQAIARCWRMGQTKQVIVKKLILKDQKDEISVIDSRIISIQESKRKLQSEILGDKNLSFNGKYSRNMNSGGTGLNRNQMMTLLR